ncbi:MAG TPA: N-acetylmuramoyl-L-alanine amidase [Bacteroidales bacterium]|nr:N-acetylmuramoyl-L-alanine amidase [Bacteroidales bacterium]
MDLMRVKNLKDFREKLTRHPSKLFPTRVLSAITNIAVHHSATKTGSAEIYARFHVNDLNWPGIGYHFVIEKDGTIKWTNNLQTVSYHVGNSNRTAVGICLTGDFREQEPTGEQWSSLFGLLKTLMVELNLSHDSVWGHSQFPGYESKACPCIDMTWVRQQLVKPAAITPNPKPDGLVLKNNKWLLEAMSRYPHLSPGAIKELNPTLPKSPVYPTPVVIKGQPQKVPDKVLNIVRAMELKGYRVFRESRKNYNLNIVGIRKTDAEPDKFNDQIVVFWLFDGKWHLREYSATTDPGLAFLNAPVNQPGNILLKDGQYLSAFRLGRTQGKFKALVQARPLTVIRNFKRNSLMFTTNGKQQTGFFGIHVYHTPGSGLNVFTRQWTAGSQLFAKTSDYAGFIKLCENAVLNWDNSFTYTLLNENDLL